MTFMLTASGLIMDNVRSTAILFELRKREIDETDNCNMRSAYEIIGQSADRCLIRKRIGRPRQGRRCPENSLEPTGISVFAAIVTKLRPVGQTHARERPPRYHYLIIPSACGSQIDSAGQ